MKVLYLDVYFLINFTVDILSIYFSSAICSVKVKIHRLIIGGTIGALIACFIALSSPPAPVFFLLLIGCVASVAIVCAPQEGLKRRIKLSAGFLIIETAIGGGVSFCYSLLDRYLYPYLEGSESKLYNKNLFVLSLIILALYLIIKIVLMLFDGIRSERSIGFTAEIGGESYEFCALVDSGALIKDPMDNSPVIILKSSALRKRNKALDIENWFLSVDSPFKDKLRIIPVKGIGCEKILYGIRCDVSLDKGKRGVKTVIAIDEEEGDFGGFDALIPAGLVDLVYG